MISGLCKYVALAATVATMGAATPAHAGATTSPPALTDARPTPALLQKAQDVAIFALGLIGVDYRFGGETPAGGVDCSGLVRYVFSHTTGISLPRTSAQMGRLGTRVPRVDLVPGDLVFFNTRHFKNSHVGIYLGDDRFVHAPSRGSEVGIASLDDAYWRKRFDGARRFVGVLRSSASPATVALSPAPKAAADSGDLLAAALARVDLTQ